ncbi:hypothetical protein [Paenibacillus oleatilyticus]|uniref:hypothetical protein n=1 Tax=Paenibacillus oleatilyticus TaxID=2594886 RepID=UPI001C1F5C0C|nr:hypothetical protein [Paenibacillus oleatilyticus]MBU7315970.1 hypothetical protein [Paenibacillus oleatilyticus]
MGMFSWTCAVSGKSLANIHSGMPPKQSKCYLVTPTETIYEDAYDGYGIFGGKDVYELLGNGDRNKGISEHFSGKGKFDIKIVLKENYCGQTYEELPQSGDCEYQGYFYDFDDEEE